MSEVPLYTRGRFPDTSDAHLKCREVLKAISQRKSQEESSHRHLIWRMRYNSQSENNYSTEMCSGSEAGSYSRLIDICIAQL